MTNDISSISSLFALLSNNSTSKTSATSNNDQGFLNLLDSIGGGGSDSTSGDSISDLFGGSSSLGLSSSAFSMLAGGGSNNTSDIDALAIQDTLAGNGPLPAYLKQVDASMGLNASQQQALQNIALENMNTDGSTASINQIAEELQQAGI